MACRIRGPRGPVPPFPDIGRCDAVGGSTSGPLSEDEMSVLRLHVTIGADLLSDIPTLAAVAPVVMATHERYDGAGYPWGLAGSNIPLGARIIAVADAHDIMTARRPYGTPLSQTEASRELGDAQEGLDRRVKAGGGGCREAAGNGGVTGDIVYYGYGATGHWVLMCDRNGARRCYHSGPYDVPSP